MHSPHPRNDRFVFLIALLVAISPSFADDVSYFRQDGGRLSEQHALPNNFSTDVHQVWRTELAPGHSSPCVSGDAVYLTTFDEDKEELATVAIDRATGKLRWRKVCPAESIEPHHQTGSPASSTVACNGDQVFAFFGSYGLLAYDADGKLLWKKPMGPFQDEFGAASSPILVDQFLVLNEDHDVNNFLIAIDQGTGKTIWKTSREGFTRSYSTPIIWDGGDSKQIIVAGALQLTGYDLMTGKKLWWVNGLSRIVDSTPILADDDVYVATWTPGGDQTERIAMEPFDEARKSFDQNDDQGIAITELPDASPVIPRFFRMDLNQDGKLDQEEWEKHASVFERAQNVAMRVRLGGEGDLTQKNILWKYRRGLPTVPSSVVYDRALYMVRDGGIITSVDTATGELLKTARAPQGRGNYYASLVAGDRKVYLASERGVVTVLKAQKNWEVLSSHDFGERIMATPAVRDGRMFIRTDQALYCFAKRD